MRKATSNNIFIDLLSSLLLVTVSIKIILDNVILHLSWKKSIDTTERLLCFIWKCQENNLWLQDSLAEILTHSTVVARSTMVAFTNKNLIFTHLYCTSYSLSVLNSLVYKATPLADLVLWAQKDSCSILRLIEFASSYYALANCVL